MRWRIDRVEVLISDKPLSQKGAAFSA